MADFLLNAGPSALTRRPRRFSQQNLRASGNQKIRHGTDFLKPMLFVKIPRAPVEVRDAGKEVLCPIEHEGLNVREQLRPRPSPSRPSCYAQQFQIVAEKEFLSHNGNAG